MKIIYLLNNFYSITHIISPSFSKCEIIDTFFMHFYVDKLYNHSGSLYFEVYISIEKIYNNVICICYIIEFLSVG